jgi:cytochrome P450
VCVLCGPSFLLLTDLQAIETIFVKQHNVWDRANETIRKFRTILPFGQLSLPTDAMWKHHRRIMGPAMTSKYLSQMTPLANDVAKELVDMFKAKAQVAGDRGFRPEADIEGATMVSYSTVNVWSPLQAD